MVKCPKVQVYLKSFSRPVDVLREGYDLAVRVRFGPIESSDLVMKPLGISGQRLVAAPALARAVAQPADPSALGQLPTLALGIDGRESHWKLDGPDGARLSVPFSPPGDRRHDGVETGRRAGRGRGGAALLMIREELADGRLIDVGRPWAPEPGSVHAVFPSRRGLLPGVRELLDFMGAEYQKLARREREECRELGERPSPAVGLPACRGLPGLSRSGPRAGQRPADRTLRPVFDGYRGGGPDSRMKPHSSFRSPP